MIHCAHDKEGAFSRAPILSAVALKSAPFIEFNSPERITIVIFDKDHHEGQTAREYFGDLTMFHDWLLEIIAILPNYICETTKGYQFGFVINGFQTVQKGFNPKNSPQHFLGDIKRRYIDYLELDINASSRNRGIFRNPLSHPHISYTHATYTLKELNDALPIEAFTPSQSTQPIKRKKSFSRQEKITTYRNCTIFKQGCREFAYSKPTKEQIFGFTRRLNEEKCYEPLPNSEIKSITNSIYKYAQNGILVNGAKKAQINREKIVKDQAKQKRTGSKPRYFRYCT